MKFSNNHNNKKKNYIKIKRPSKISINHNNNNQLESKIKLNGIREDNEYSSETSYITNKIKQNQRFLSNEIQTNNNNNVININNVYIINNNSSKKENNNINDEGKKNKDDNSINIIIKEITIPKKMGQNKHFFYCLNKNNKKEKFGPILYVNPVARRAYNPGDGESINDYDYKNVKDKRCCSNCDLCYCHLTRYQLFNCCLSEKLFCCFEVFLSYLFCFLSYITFCIIIFGRFAYVVWRHGR